MGGVKAKKAGVVIYGTNAEGKRAFVMPYSEGRFGYGDKYYVLPKGSVDKNEEVRAAAVRETEEETGISIKTLIGEKALAAFEAGGALPQMPFDSPGYPGVRVAHIGMVPVSHSYTARSGKKRPTDIFGIEVEGIERLAPYLKNQRNANTADFKVRDSVFNAVHDAEKYPQLADFIEWLRTGEMPAREWNAGKPKPPPLYDIRHGSPFERIEQETMGQKIHMLDQWKAFFLEMNSHNYDEMQKYCGAIKKAISDLGITKGDSDTLKLDDKDTPLQFFQEGADIITAEDYVRRCTALLQQNLDYALGFGGAGGSSQRMGKQPRMHIKQSQMVAAVPFIPAAELKHALQTQLPLSAWQKRIPFSESGIEALYQFHPVFTPSCAMPDYFTSRASSDGIAGQAANLR